MSYFLKEFINREAEVKISFLQLKNLIVPEQPEVKILLIYVHLKRKKFYFFITLKIKIDDNPEFFIYKYLVRFSSINDEYDSYSSSSDFNQHKLHSMISENILTS